VNKKKKHIIKRLNEKHQLIGNPAVTAALVRPVEAGLLIFKFGEGIFLNEIIGLG